MRGAVLDARVAPVIMGVVNVTPDSFSDGGRFYGPDDAIAEGMRHIEDGAHLVDVGGESTRPGAAAVSAHEELRRIMPVIEGLVERGAAVSVDTSKPDVAAAAIEAGAAVINDVAGFEADGMADVVADSGVGAVVMHMLGDPRTMQDNPEYNDVVGDIATYLTARIDALVAAGVDRSRIAIDPGIGFGKTMAHNLSLLDGIATFAALAPVLIGTSRKSFLGTITGRPPAERDVATAATVALAIAGGASIVRVHNVAFAADAAAIAHAMVENRAEHPD